jgi:hypothetical protein
LSRPHDLPSCHPRTATHYHRRVQVRAEGAAKASKPTRLSSQSAGLFVDAGRSRWGGARREGEGGAVEAHGHPGCHPCPAAATTSVRSPLRSLSHAAPPPPITCIPLRPSYITCHSTGHARTCYHPFDPLVAVVDSSSMRWTLPPPERREKGGAVEATRPPRLPPAPCH